MATNGFPKLFFRNSLIAEFQSEKQLQGFFRVEQADATHGHTYHAPEQLGKRLCRTSENVNVDSRQIGAARSNCPPFIGKE